MHRLTAFFICISMAGCFASTDPPDPDTFGVVFPQASVRVGGLEGSDQILLRFHTENNVYTFGARTALAPSTDGTFRYIHTFESGADSYSILIVIDRDGDGIGEPGELAFYQSDNLFEDVAGGNRYGSDGRRLGLVELQLEDLTVLEELTVEANSIEPNENFICLFAPIDAGDWRVRSLQNNNQGQRRPLSDWFFRAFIQTDGSGFLVETIPTGLLPGIDYIPLCIDDNDRSESFNTGDTGRLLNAFSFTNGEVFQFAY